MAEIEHIIKSLPIDENLQDQVNALVREGWNTVPGVPPVAVYHLVREKRKSFGAAGVMQVDDSKIMIIPANGTKQ